jgi:hypothetical protein
LINIITGFEFAHATRATRHLVLICCSGLGFFEPGLWNGDINFISTTFDNMKQKKIRQRVELPTVSLPTYLGYPAKEDIYIQAQEIKALDPDDLSPIDPSYSAKNSGELPTGADLDVPGSELDDPDEEIGEEDEENNYYSLGSDRHEDLDEN